MFGRRRFGEKHPVVTRGMGVPGIGATLGITLLGALVAGCGDDVRSAETLIVLGDASPGDIVSMRDAGDGVVEWIDREDGRIMAIDTTEGAEPTPTVVAEVNVATAGEQWGLLSSVVLDDGRRFATWTQPGPGDFDSAELVVGEIVDGTAARVVWNAGRVGSGGIGGVLDVSGDRLLLGLGQNVGWADDSATRGALVTIDPDGPIDQGPVVVSEGYVNPWAFTVVADGATGVEVWVADNAAGEERGAPGVDDVERLGRADLADRPDLPRTDLADRAPSAMVELPDGRIGICGFLDNELRAYEIVDTEAGQRTALDRAGTIMPCSTAAAVLDDGSIVTVGLGDRGLELTVLRP